MRLIQLIQRLIRWLHGAEPQRVAPPARRALPRCEVLLNNRLRPNVRRYLEVVEILRDNPRTLRVRLPDGSVIKRKKARDLPSGENSAFQRWKEAFR